MVAAIRQAAERHDILAILTGTRAKKASRPWLGFTPIRAASRVPKRLVRFRCTWITSICGMAKNRCSGRGNRGTCQGLRCREQTAYATGLPSLARRRGRDYSCAQP